jgi:hypothetical protein
MSKNHKKHIYKISTLHIFAILIILILASVTIFQFRFQTKGNLESSNGIVKPDLGEFKSFTSKDLGISFDYASGIANQQVKVKQIGNKVYLYVDYTKTDDPTQGKFVEVFSKSPNQSLIKAIEEQILTNYSLESCPIRLANVNTSLKNPARQFVQITTTAVTVHNIQKQKTAEKLCPPIYTYNGRTGMAYFMMDTKYPNKFVFFNLGQDNFWGTPPNDKGIGLTWDQTVRFIEN